MRVNNDERIDGLNVSIEVKYRYQSTKFERAKVLPIPNPGISSHTTLREVVNRARASALEYCQNHGYKFLSCSISIVIGPILIESEKPSNFPRKPRERGTVVSFKKNAR